MIIERIAKVRQLPEAIDVNASDWLLIEKPDDSYKLPISYFYDYIETSMVSLKDIVNDKISEANTVIKLTKDSETQRSKTFELWTIDENQRKTNEENRNNNEDIRESNELERSNNESERITNEDERNNNEESRILNEEERNNGESTRLVQETKRMENEEDRMANETSRVANEEERVVNENERIAFHELYIKYLNNVKDLVDSRAHSKISSGTTGVAKLLDVIIKPKDNIYTDAIYKALVNLNFSDGTNSTSVPIMIECKSDGTSVLNNIKTSNWFNPDTLSMAGYIPSSDMIRLCYSISKTETTFSLCVKVDSNISIECNRIWDNVTSFDIEYFDTVLYENVYIWNDYPDSTTMSILELIDSFPYDLEQPSADTIVNQLVDTNKPDFAASFMSIAEMVYHTTDFICNLKPVSYWPVGSIYRTTLSDDPSTILGGGEWEILHGGPITNEYYEEATDNNGNKVQGQLAYTETIYEWVRIL